MSREELKTISTLLQEAIECGLEAEVVCCALKTMREDDAINPVQAMQEAMNEWVK